MTRRRAIAASALAVAGSLWLAAASGAATANLGRIAPMGPTGGCGGCTYFQSASDSASNSYRVPPGGPWTVTSWSSRGGSMADTARLRILRPTANPGEYALVAESADVDIGAVAAPVTPVSIPVLPGDVIGLRTLGSGDLPGQHPSAFAADGASFVIGGPFNVGQTTGPAGTFPFGTTAANYTNVAATVTAPDPVPVVGPGPAPGESDAAKKCKKPKKKKKAKPRAGAKKKKRCGRKKGKRKR